MEFVVPHSSGQASPRFNQAPTYSSHSISRTFTNVGRVRLPLVNRSTLDHMQSNKLVMHKNEFYNSYEYEEKFEEDEGKMLDRIDSQMVDLEEEDTTIVNSICVLFYVRMLC